MKVLKLGAIWCKECIIMRPMWEEIEKEMPELKTEYIDIDEHPEILSQYNVSDIPAFIFLDRRGEEIIRLKGAQNKEELLKICNQNFDR